MIKQNDPSQNILQLQQAVAAGDTHAFEQLYLLFYADLHEFAFRIIKSYHIAEEIVEDVFVQIWKKRSSLPEVRELRVFLYVAVKNLALTYLYKARKEKVCWIEEFALDSLKSDARRPDELLEAKEFSAELQLVINQLPVKCKAVFKLVKEEGFKYQEAARLLNLSVKTIENQMGIALKKIALGLKLGERLKG
ncbi:MAG: polymerase sigma-70 factor [Ferruginibacter sp.]|nr:polymerase sigma-70 factor [Ferruginibacter sp.]